MEKAPGLSQSITRKLGESQMLVRPLPSHFRKSIFLSTFRWASLTPYTQGSGVSMCPPNWTHITYRLVRQVPSTQAEPPGWEVSFLVRLPTLTTPHSQGNESAKPGGPGLPVQAPQEEGRGLGEQESAFPGIHLPVRPGYLPWWKSKQG